MKIAGERVAWRWVWQSATCRAWMQVHERLARPSPLLRRGQNTVDLRAELPAEETPIEVGEKAFDSPNEKRDLVTQFRWNRARPLSGRELERRHPCNRGLG
jgi:hypothetical protein